MLISPAYAQSGAGAGFDIMALAPLVLIFVVFYFLLIRPQQKKMKQHREMLSAVRRGDRVVVGGIIRGAVSEVLSKTEPVKAESADKSAEDKPASGN
jgi:preprotein translocase subunit YajC